MGKRRAHGFPSYLFDRHEIKKAGLVRERADGPNACDTNHCLLEVVIGTDALCGVQHGLHHGERWRRKKKLASCPTQIPSPEEKDNKEDTRHVQPYLTCALCLRLGYGPAVPVHDRPLGGRGGGITADVSNGTGSREGPLG